MIIEAAKGGVAVTAQIVVDWVISDAASSGSRIHSLNELELVSTAERLGLPSRR